MPYFNRGYRRRGYSRTYRRSRWPYRSWRRSSMVRAERSGRRTFSCSIPSNEAFQLTVPATKYWSNLVAVSPYFYDSSMAACKCSLIQSPLYRVYTTLYDQVKINGVTLKISVMTNIGAGGLVSACKLVTQWDRDAQYKEVVEGEDLPTTSSLENGSESQSKLIVNNTRAIIYRSNWASDIQERTTFHDCSIDKSGGTWYDRSYREGPVGYCPSLFMALMSASAPAVGASYVFDIAVEAVWRVTFRNPKYGLSVGSSKGLDEIKVEPVKVEGAGKSASKSVTFDAGAVSDVLPSYTGLLGDVVDRLTVNMREEGVYSDGEYDHDEDIEFAYKKLGDEVFHQLFKDVYDDDLKKVGLIVEKEVSG